jgi:hypothetical protein
MRITLVKLQDKLKEDFKNINQVHKKMKHMIQYVLTMKKRIIMKLITKILKILDRATSQK